MLVISSIMVIAAITLPVLVFWQSWRWRNRRLLELASKVPGPPALPVLGNALLFMASPNEQLKVIGDLMKQYGQYVRFWLGPDLNIIVTNPEDIKLLLTSNKVNQKGPVYEYMKEVIGPGILTGDKVWRHHRKLVTPSYNKKSIQHFARIFNIEAACFADALCRKEPGTFNIYYDVVKCTTQCVCQTLMGLSKDESQNLKYLDEVVLKTHSMYGLIFSKMTKWWLQIPLIFWLSGNKKNYHSIIDLINNLSEEILERRRQALARNEGVENVARGIVDRLILSGELSEQEMKWETFTLFTTSQEASAKIAAAVLLFLAHLPEWQNKVYDEIQERLGPNDDFLTDEQLKQLQYLDMVYKEVLRYVSIAPLIQRTVEEEITIDSGKITLPVGTSLAIPVHILHRDPQYWDEPDKVKPERFLPENTKRRNPNAFIPFSLGAMDCLGRVFATTMIKTIVVKLLRRLTFEADGCIEDLDIEVAVSVKFSKGYNLRASPRKAQSARAQAVAYFTMLVISSIMVIAAITLPVLVFWQSWRWRNRRLLELASKVPGPPALPVLGNALLFMASPNEQLKVIGDLMKQYGQYVRFWLGPDLNIIVTNPEDIKLLLTNNKVNQKGPVYEYMKEVIGPGILTGDKVWRHHRKLVTPSYNKKSIQHFARIFNIEAACFADALCRKEPGTFNIYYDVVKCTTQCVCQTLMGLSKDESQNLKYLDEVVLKTHSIYGLIFSKMTKWWLQIPLIFWLSGNKKNYHSIINLINNLSEEILERRRQALARNEGVENVARGIVDRLILSGELSEQEMKWETFTLFTTSQEASAKIAAAVLLFLAHLPEWQNKVYDEIQERLGPNDDFLTDEQLKQLQYLDMVYKEVLRYVSIAPLIQRTVEEEITIDSGKITLPVGTSLAIPVHILHRDPQYWDEPDKVKPERFLPENTKRRNPNAFIPFSLGAMDCLGRVFATTMIKTIVVKLLRRLTFEADGCIEDLDIEVAVSVKFSKGYNLRASPRKAQSARAHAVA